MTFFLNKILFTDYSEAVLNSILKHWEESLLEDEEVGPEHRG